VRARLLLWAHCDYVDFYQSAAVTRFAAQVHTHHHHSGFRLQRKPLVEEPI